MKIPFRFDIVGSFLRPEELKKARLDYKESRISLEELKEVEDRLIADLIKKQLEVGLQAVTDGEFRRRWWHLDFIESLNGITKYSKMVQAFSGQQEMELSYVSGKLSFNHNHPFIEDFKRTQKLAGDHLVKQTIPGPGMVLIPCFITSDIYQDKPFYEKEEELKKDLINTYQEAILAFYKAGCRYLQLDDTSWGSLFADRHRELIQHFGYDPDRIIEELGDITEEVLKVKPQDMAITTHMCRGNFMSRWLYEGRYDRIAKRLLSIEGFDGFFLEYDDERSGDFDPLRHLKNQRMVLGLVTTKTGELEDEGEVIDRIKEASNYVPLDRLCISPQCGFASTEEGNAISEEDQWKKLRFISQIAKKVWDQD